MSIEFTLKYCGKSFDLKTQETPISIGRSRSCTYSIKDPKLSSRHCIIYIKDSIVFIEDLESKNGVFLNDIKVQKQKICLNDLISIGDCEIVVNRLKLKEDSLKLLGRSRNSNRDLTLELSRPVKLNSRVKFKKVDQKTQVKNNHKSKKSNNRSLKILFSIVLIFFIALIIYESFS